MRNEMKIDYKPTYFKPYELVPKKVYLDWGLQSLRFLDDRILKTGDRLRERYGTAIINDWHWSGDYDSRGFRLPNDPDGARLSAHKRGQALDIIFNKVRAQKVRQDILDNPGDPDFEYITLLETNISWLHISCENVERIQIIDP